MISPWTEMVEADAAAYKRERDLPKLICMEPEVDDDERIVWKLRQILNSYRTLAITKHWSYDTNHHVALLAAFKAETANLSHQQNLQGLADIVQKAAE